MQKTISITNKYIILATPLILYTLFSSIYFVIAAGNGRIINIIFAIILFMLMTAAFMAGWFHMIRLALENRYNDEPNALIREFVPGVGEFFISSTGALLTIFIISTLILVGSFSLGSSLIGETGVSSEDLLKAMQNNANLKAFVSSLSFEQLNKLNQWNMLLLGTLTLIYYLFFLYLPTLFFQNKNPLKSFLISLKNLFSKKIFKTTAIFLLIYFLYSMISVFMAVLGSNAIMHFFLTLLNFYFVTASAVGIFYYFQINFVDTKVGQNVDVEI